MSWIVIGVICSQAQSAGGSPTKVIRGVDYSGLTCGISEGVEDKKYAAWVLPLPTLPEAFNVKTCVSACNETSSGPNLNNDIILPHKSVKVMYFCIPTPVSGGASVSINVTFTGDLQTASQLASQAMADLLTAWWVILVSVGVALVMAFGYTYVSKYASGCLVWTVVLMIIAAGAALGYAFYKKAAEAKDSPLEERSKAMFGLAYTTWAITFIFACVCYFLRDRIAIAVEVVKEGSKAIQDMKSMVFFPIGPLLFTVGYMAFWIFVTLMLFSVGEMKSKEFSPKWGAEVATFASGGYPQYGPVTPGAVYFDSLAKGNNTYRDWEWVAEGYKYSWAFHFFHLLWVVQFVVYFTYIVIAGAVANWYFTRTNDQGEKIRGDEPDQLPRNPIWESFKRSFLCHLGTVAFASLIIAICQFIRYCIRYIDEQSKKRGTQTRVEKCLLSCAACCMRLVECCLDKISKNALVWTAIWGDSFLVAACSSFKLIWNNLARVAAINMVSGFLMLLGRVLIALATTAICSFVMQGALGDELNSVVMPSVVIFILAFIIASLFMVLFETAIDCIFLCFLVDEALFKGAKMYAPESLASLVNKHGDISAKKAALMRQGSTHAADPASSADTATVVQPVDAPDGAI